jgi:hypothetical protein
MMTHLHTLKLVPADLDRLHGTLARAGVVTETPYLHPFELIAAIEHLAARVQSRTAAAPSTGGEGVLSRR